MRLHTSLYTIYIELRDSGHYLLVHGYTGAIDLVERHVADFLRRGGLVTQEDIATGQVPLTSETIEILRRRGYLTDRSPLGEREHVKKMAQLFQKITSKKCSFLFLVAYDCNFRCPYCFENSISASGKGWSKKVFSKEMSDRAYQAMLELQPNRDQHSRMITLYGGEPLLAENYEIVSYVVKQGIKRGYTFSAITNGYDLDRYASLLGPGMIESVQITIDGMPDTHNKRRIHYLGVSTFNHIMDNVDRVLRAGVNVSIRVNTDFSNFADLDQLSAVFRDKGWSDMSSFSAYSALVTAAGESIQCNTVMSRKAKKPETNSSSCGCSSSSTPATQLIPTIDIPQCSISDVTSVSSSFRPSRIDTTRSTASEKHAEQETPRNSAFDPDAQYIDFDEEEKRIHQLMIDGRWAEVCNQTVGLELMPRAHFTQQYYNQLKQHPQLKAISCQDFGIKALVKKVLRGEGLMSRRSTFCGAQDGMFIFDPYGDLYTCWEVVGMERYKVGTYGEKVVMDKEELDNWRGRNISTVPACSKCKYAFFCGGGCEAHALLEGRGPRSPYCDGFPPVFRTVVLEAYKEFVEAPSSIEAEKELRLQCY